MSKLNEKEQRNKKPIEKAYAQERAHSLENNGVAMC